MPSSSTSPGTLQYTREIDLDAARLGAGLHLWLDLGEVHEVAEVILNGQNLGILWKPPWRVDLTGAARPGKNTLAVRVTNFWPNRIIGDQFLPEAAARDADQHPQADPPDAPDGVRFARPGSTGDNGGKCDTILK